MTSEGSRRCEFAELVSDHVLGDEYLHVNLAVMDHERLTDELGNDRASAGPRLDGLAGAAGVHSLDFGEQLRIDERSFF